MQYVVTVDSCWLEQAIEPSASLNTIEENYTDPYSLNIGSAIENTLLNGSSSDGTSAVDLPKESPINIKKLKNIWILFAHRYMMKLTISRKGYQMTL